MNADFAAADRASASAGGNEAASGTAAPIDKDSRAASDPPAQVIKLDTGFTVPFPVDVPAGTYYIRISGQWDDGDIAYKFKMLVTS